VAHLLDEVEEGLAVGFETYERLAEQGSEHSNIAA
jgi:hypothetical protein